MLPRARADDDRTLHKSIYRPHYHAAPLRPGGHPYPLIAKPHYPVVDGSRFLPTLSISVDEQVELTMSKTSFLSLICGLMLFGVLFFMSGFLAAFYIYTAPPKVDPVVAKPHDPTSTPYHVPQALGLYEMPMPAMSSVTITAQGTQMTPNQRLPTYAMQSKTETAASARSVTPAALR